MKGSRLAHAAEGQAPGSQAATQWSRRSPRLRRRHAPGAERKPPGGWRPERGSWPRRSAAPLFTSDNAYAEFAEKRRGRIAPGFDADFTVLDREIFAPGTPAGEILKAKVVMTVVGGEIVYKAN